MAKSVTQQLVEKGIDIGEAVEYTTRWGGFSASEHYGFTWYYWDKFYAKETGKHSSTGEFNSSPNKTIGDQLLETVLHKLSAQDTRIEEQNAEISRCHRLIELKTNKDNEQQIMVAEEILKLCHA